MTNYFRFKDLYCLPQEKHELAWQALYAQYLMLAPLHTLPTPKTTTTEAETKKTELLSLLDEYQQQKKQKTQHINTPKIDEFKAYRALILSDIQASSNPFKWWQQKEQEFPTLASLVFICRFQPPKPLANGRFHYQEEYVQTQEHHWLLSM